MVSFSDGGWLMMIVVALPFLQKTIVFLYPIGVYGLLYVFSFLGINWSKLMMGVYFPPQVPDGSIDG